MKKYKPIDTSEIKTYSIKTRNNKININDHFGKSITAGMSLARSTLWRKLSACL